MWSNSRYQEIILLQWFLVQRKWHCLFQETGSQECNIGIWYRDYTAEFSEPSYDTHLKCVVQEMTLDNSRQAPAICAPYLDHNLDLRLVMWLRILFCFYTLLKFLFSIQNTSQTQGYSPLWIVIYTAKQNI